MPCCVPRADPSESPHDLACRSTHDLASATAITASLLMIVLTSVITGTVLPYALAKAGVVRSSPPPATPRLLTNARTYCCLHTQV